MQIIFVNLIESSWIVSSGWLTHIRINEVPFSPAYHHITIAQTDDEYRKVFKEFISYLTCNA